VDFSSLSTCFSDREMHIRISVDNFTVKFLLSFFLQNCLDLNSFRVVFLPTLKYSFRRWITDYRSVAPAFNEHKVKLVNCQSRHFFAEYGNTFFQNNGILHILSLSSEIQEHAGDNSVSTFTRAYLMHCVRNQFFRHIRGLQPCTLVAWTDEDDPKEV